MLAARSFTDLVFFVGATIPPKLKDPAARLRVLSFGSVLYRSAYFAEGGNFLGSQTHP